VRKTRLQLCYSLMAVNQECVLSDTTTPVRRKHSHASCSTASLGRAPLTRSSSRRQITSRHVLARMQLARVESQHDAFDTEASENVVTALLLEIINRSQLYRSRITETPMFTRTRTASNRQVITFFRIRAAAAAAGLHRSAKTLQQSIDTRE